MTVNPGFGGQAFVGETVPKIQQADGWRRQSGWRFRVAVDGGITMETARECARAGADTFVCGTSVFRHHNLGAALRRIDRAIDGVRVGPADRRPRGPQDREVSR